MKNIRFVDEYHHQEHHEWNSKLDYYIDELNTFKKEMDEILIIQFGRSSIRDLAITYQDVIQECHHDIEQIKVAISHHEQLIADQTHVLLDDAVWEHTGMRDDINELDENFEKLKINIHAFTKKYLIHYLN